MPRLLFEKTGDAVWISHLDLMRLFQRAFKRAGLLLKHTQGFNQRPSVSIALPMSVGIESQCELLDFELDGQTVDNNEIVQRLNRALIPGVKVTQSYDTGSKLKNLAYMDCLLRLEYDEKAPANAASSILQLFSAPELMVDKKGKNGITAQDIIPLIKRIHAEEMDGEICISARICCQNPTLNPMQIAAAIQKYLPEYAPNHVRYRRMELFDLQEQVYR